MSLKIAIIGGGASGFFAAITAAEKAKTIKQELEIHIFESAPHYLQKVRISGGGRCNVTHHLFEINPFCLNYPRGARELKSAFHQFQASDTVKWFKSKGVTLIVEEDGRMFPSTHKSDTIINCFMHTAEKLDVQIHTRTPIDNIQFQNDKFHLYTREQKQFTFDRVLIATGSAKKGYQLAKIFGHQITDLAPSLFSFKINSPLLKDLAGTSFEYSKLKLKVGKNKFLQQGPLLITHWGLSGPAILKLSAWAARDLKKEGYRATLSVNWTSFDHLEEVTEKLHLKIKENSKTMLKNISFDGLTKRFWHNFLLFLQINPEKKWNELSHKEINKLCQNLFCCELTINGQNRFKDEFVECGGVSLKEINFKTMESRLQKGLYFTGEILDIDGVTGGFNFQNAWTTGHIAGLNIILK